MYKDLCHFSVTY